MLLESNKVLKENLEKLKVFTKKFLEKSESHKVTMDDYDEFNSLLLPTIKLSLLGESEATIAVNIASKISETSEYIKFFMKDNSIEDVKNQLKTIAKSLY